MIFISFPFSPVFKITDINIFNILESYSFLKMTAKHEFDKTILIGHLLLLFITDSIDLKQSAVSPILKIVIML